MASSGTITRVDDMILGGTCVVEYNSPLASYYYKIRFSMDTWENWTDVLHNSSSGIIGYLSTTDIPEVVCRRLPNSMQGIMTATLYTYSDSACKNTVGSPSSKNFKVQVPNTVIPSITSANIQLDNSANSVLESWSDNGVSVAVAGISKLKVEATSTGKYYSTVTSVTLSGEINKTFEGNRVSYTQVLTEGNNKTVTFVARDTRGQNSNPMTIGLIPTNVYVYKKPQILSFQIGRILSNPTKITAKINWTYASVGGHNQSKVTLKYKERSANSWTTYNGTINNNILTTLSTTFKVDKSYNFLIIVTDSLGEKVQVDAFVATMETPFHLKAGGRGLGIGRIAESDNLEIGFKTIFMNDVIIQVGANKVLLADYIKGVMNGTYT